MFNKIPKSTVLSLGVFAASSRCAKPRRGSLLYATTKQGALACVTVFALCMTGAVSGTTIDLADKGGAYTVTSEDLQTNFTNSAPTTATLTFNFSSETAYAGVISGDIKVVDNGGGRALFTTSSTFTGGVDVKKGSIVCAADHALGSGPITIAKDLGMLVGSGAVCPNDIHLAGNAFLSFKAGGGTFAGNVTGASGITMTPYTTTAGAVNFFTGSITIPNGTIAMPDGQDLTVRFYGPVTVATVVQESRYHRTAAYFYSKENDFACLRLIRQQDATHAPYFADAAIPHSCCITGGISDASGSRLNVVSFAGSQRMRHVTATAGVPITMNASSSGSLTLTDSGNGPYVLFRGAMDLTYDPEDGGAWALTNGASTMTGTLTVTNAVMTIEQAATFKNLTKAVVSAGAELKVATATANAFAALSDLTVAGTLEVDSAANAPFSSKSLTIRIEGEGKLNVVSDLTLNVPFLTVAGAHVAPGTYNKANCTWVTGEGSVYVANAGISSWADAVSGLWSETAKWVHKKLPGSEPAYITANRADYTVTVDVPTLDPVTTLIGSSSGHTSTVAVTSDVCLGSKTSVVQVVRGGVFDVRSGSFTSSNTSSRCKVTDGGIWRVSGGTCNFRTDGSSSFQVSDGGRLEISAGAVSLQNTQYAYQSPFSFNNGIIDITGGKLETVNSEGEFNPLGSGEITVGGNGTLSIARGWIGPKVAGKRLHIVTKDQGVIRVGNALAIGSTLAGGETLIELNSSATCMSGWEMLVGCDKACRVQVDVNSGASLSVGGYALAMGVQSNSSTSSPTGIVNVAGGTCSVSGNWYGSDYGQAGTWCGGFFNVASGSSVKPYGELNLRSSSSYTQSMGIFAVGLAHGEGYVTIDGASIMTKSGDGEVLVGVFGGKGTLSVRGGGKATFSKKMYVGGVEKTSLTQTGRIDDTAFTPTDAVGVVEVDDGEMTVGETLVLGEKGSGTLRLGAGAKVTAKNFEMRDTTASELDFTFGPSGVGTLTVSQTATISSQAKLRIDLTAHAGVLRRTLLIKAPTVTGAFDADNVTFVGLTGARLQYRADGIYVKGPPQGMVFILR